MIGERRAPPRCASTDRIPPPRARLHPHCSLRRPRTSDLSTPTGSCRTSQVPRGGWTEGPQDALLAPGPPGLADPPPVADQPHVHRNSQVRRDEVFQGSMGPGRGRSGGQQAEPGGHPVHVRVDGDCRAIQRERQHAGDGLGPDSGEGAQVPGDLVVRSVAHPAQVEAPFPPADLAEHGQDPGGLGIGQPAGPDRVGERGRPGSSQGGPRRIPSPHRRIGSIAVHVAGVLGHDREDQLFQWIEPTRRIQRTVRPLEPGVDLADRGGPGRASRTAHCGLA
jgi:hypothetical protein